MARIPTPLVWKRRNFAVLEPMGMVDRFHAVAASGIVSGPFAIYSLSDGRWFKLIHLPSQSKILEMGMQNCCKDAAERFAALDLNWWTCIPEEVIGPDLQEMRNLYTRLRSKSWVTGEWVREG
jgi:hypothetical protein